MTNGIMMLLIKIKIREAKYVANVTAPRPNFTSHSSRSPYNGAKAVAAFAGSSKVMDRTNTIMNVIIRLYLAHL